MESGFERRFSQGDIVYWCNQIGHRYNVSFGMVDEQFYGAVCIDLLEKKETRYINGIPLDDFEPEQEYKKLPKGWTYDTKLFDLEYRMTPEDEKLWNEVSKKIDDPELIKRAYEAGILVKSEKIFHGHIEDDIDKKKGYRLVRAYSPHENIITHVSIRPDKVYFTYQEAAEEVKSNILEFERQANLSDYDWQVEQIDKTLLHWKTIYGKTNEKVESYRNWILEMKNVEDIEVRIYMGEIQWKYSKNKRWNNIVL